MSDYEMTDEELLERMPHEAWCESRECETCDSDDGTCWLARESGGDCAFEARPCNCRHAEVARRLRERRDQVEFFRELIPDDYRRTGGFLAGCPREKISANTIYIGIDMMRRQYWKMKRERDDARRALGDDR